VSFLWVFFLCLLFWGDAEYHTALPFSYSFSSGG